MHFAKQIPMQSVLTLSVQTTLPERLQLDQHRQTTFKLSVQVRLVARQLLQLVGLKPLTQRLIFDGFMVTGFFFLGVAQG